MTKIVKIHIWDRNEAGKNQMLLKLNQIKSMKQSINQSTPTKPNDNLYPKNSLYNLTHLHIRFKFSGFFSEQEEKQNKVNKQT